MVTCPFEVVIWLSKHHLIPRVDMLVRLTSAGFGYDRLHCWVPLFQSCSSCDVVGVTVCVDCITQLESCLLYQAHISFNLKRSRLKSLGLLQKVKPSRVAVTCSNTGSMMTASFVLVSASRYVNVELSESWTWVTDRAMARKDLLTCLPLTDLQHREGMRLYVNVMQAQGDGHVQARARTGP